MQDRPSLLRQAWNLVLGRNRLENADGTITTIHGARIIPYRVTYSESGALHTNAPEFAGQPRMTELVEQMRPWIAAAKNDWITLDEKTGKFFLRELDPDGIEKFRLLGEIDMQHEPDLYRHAMQIVAVEKIFTPASAAEAAKHNKLNK